MKGSGWQFGSKQVPSRLDGGSSPTSNLGNGEQPCQQQQPYHRIGRPSCTGCSRGSPRNSAAERTPAALVARARIGVRGGLATQPACGRSSSGPRWRKPFWARLAFDVPTKWVLVERQGRDLQLRRLERQGPMTLEELLADLPTTCDTGVKRNERGHQECWQRCKLHIDAIDGGLRLAGLASRSVSAPFVFRSQTPSGATHTSVKPPCRCPGSSGQFARSGRSMLPLSRSPVAHRTCSSRSRRM